MTRKEKLFLNTLTAFIRQAIVIVCGFILPRQILLRYGNDVNGLVASITQFLSFISFLELGIGPVIQSNLYKPLAIGDEKGISRVIKSSNNFFRKLALIFLGYIFILFFLYPNVVNDSFDFWFTASLVLIISISTFAEYYFGMTYTLLLNADQKVYVQSIVNILIVLLNTICCIVLIKMGCSIHIVKLISALIFVLKPLFLNIYVSKKYCIDKSIVLSEEPIQQKWNGFAQHLASTISNNIDIVLLTTFSSLVNVSIYSVYHTVTYGISNIILLTVAGLESYWGNMIANGENSTLIKSFDTIEYVMHITNTFIFSVTAIMITPFVNIYISGVENAEMYNVPMFGTALVLSYFMMCLRIPYFRIIKASGHYKQTQNGSFISMGLNIVFSVLLVFKYDLMGVAIGTFIAFTFHTIYLAWYLQKNIINRPIKFFIKNLLTDILFFVVMFLISMNINLRAINYLEWIVDAIKVSVIGILILGIISIMFYRKQVRQLFLFIRNKT